MEFRIEKAALCFLMFLPALAGAVEFRFEAMHDHPRKSGRGILIIADNGISFRETDNKKHVFEWPYSAIQQLDISKDRLRILTYEDSKLKLGADRSEVFRLEGEERFDKVYDFLMERMDQRFVSGLAEEPLKPEWEIPAKHLGRMGGSHGALIVAADRVVYKAEGKGESRTWRDLDIENISSTGPFQLSLTTYERARTHYGSRKQFHFQLKERLAEERYNALWRRLNQTKGLNLQ
jgi:hypothetical protein